MFYMRQNFVYSSWSPQSFPVFRGWLHRYLQLKGAVTLLLKPTYMLWPGCLVAKQGLASTSCELAHPINLILCIRSFLSLQY